MLSADRPATLPFIRHHFFCIIEFYCVLFVFIYGFVLAYFHYFLYSLINANKKNDWVSQNSDGSILSS